MQVVRYGEVWCLSSGEREAFEDCRWGGEERCEVLDLHPGPPQGVVLKWGLAWKQASEVAVTLVREKCRHGLYQVISIESQRALGGSRHY